MKKTLIALAAVAATSASFAQSTVTLSGTVDVGIEKRFSGDATRMTANRNGTSNWTLSGAEDLGGGLKAVFQVSTSFNSDTGTVSSTDGLGNNGLFVGLTGGFGTLRAGRPVNTLYGNVLLANGTKGVSAHDANSVLGGNATVNAKTSNASNSVYVPNAVQYHSPRFGGVQVQVEYAPSESTAVGNKAGKALLTLPAGALVVPPKLLGNREQDWLAAVTTEGRLLVFKVADLPQLGKGKGNKIIGIPGERVASREEYLTDLAVLPAGATLVLQAGKRTLSLKADDLEHYKGERGRRGNKLPRGFQRVDSLLVEGLNT